MASIASLLADKRKQQEALLSTADFIALVLLYDPWDGYDPVRDIELLVRYLGPLRRSDIPHTPVPSIAHNWQMKALAQTIGVAEAQIYTMILQDTSNEKTS